MINRREFTQAGLGALGIAALAPGAVSAAPSILTKPIPSSGELLPIVGLGTNRYGVANTAAARAPLAEALSRFVELNGSLVDTAPMYGRSEAVLGTLIEELNLRQRLFLATKTDRDPGGDASSAQMATSSERLKSEKLDLMQVHNLRDWKKTLPVLREAKASGKLRYIGITTSRQRQYEEFEHIMKTESLDFVQVNYSLAQREAADRLLPLAQDLGIAVIINRAFAGGRLFAATEGLSLPDWVKSFGCDSWAQFFLKYAVGHPAATLSIPGMTKRRHVDDNMGALQGRLPDTDERREMETFFDAL